MRSPRPLATIRGPTSKRRGGERKGRREWQGGGKRKGRREKEGEEGGNVRFFVALTWQPYYSPVVYSLANCCICKYRLFM